jgi:hypothetical protein
MLIAFLWIVWLHFVADFMMQSDKVSKAKSGSNKVLLYHVTLYGLPFVPFALWHLPAGAAAAFVGINVAAHFATDWVTSRMTSKLWKAGDVHNFFVVIGADQAIHMTTLFLTYAWLAQAWRP